MFENSKSKPFIVYIFHNFTLIQKPQNIYNNPLLYLTSDFHYFNSIHFSF
jgi:hypothetical protein